MRPAAAFVRALAAGDAEAVRSAAEAKPDWHKVAELAELHEVEALCWWEGEQLGRCGAFELPSVLRDRLQLSYLHHRLRNEALAENLAHLADGLRTAGVEALYLKGPWVAFHAYPEPGTRPVGDIDLCVRERHYAGALEALRSAGWQPGKALPKSPTEALAESHYHRQLRFVARGRRPVELHFRLLNMGPPGPEESRVWENARELDVGSLRLRVPGPEAMLLHLLLHANQHGFAVLRLLHDIRFGLEADRAVLDMAGFRRTVRGLGCAAACYHALELAAELAGARPDGVEALRPSRARRALFSRLWQLGAARRLEANRWRQEMESPLFYLLEMGRPVDKLRYALRVTASAGGPLGLVQEILRLAAPPHPRRRGPR